MRHVTYIIAKPGAEGHTKPGRGSIDDVGRRMMPGYFLDYPFRPPPTDLHPRRQRKSELHDPVIEERRSQLDGCGASDNQEQAYGGSGHLAPGGTGNLHTNHPCVQNRAGTESGVRVEDEHGIARSTCSNAGVDACRVTEVLGQQDDFPHPLRASRRRREYRRWRHYRRLSP